MKPWTVKKKRVVDSGLASALDSGCVMATTYRDVRLYGNEGSVVNAFKDVAWHSNEISHAHHEHQAFQL